MKKIPTFVKILIPVILVIAVFLVLFFCGVFEGKVEVPDLTKISIEEAEKLLEENGLSIYVSDTVISNEVDENTVMSQSPKAGEKVKKNTTVSVVISEKSYEIEVPYVVDYKKELATQKLEAIGLEVEIKEEKNDLVPASVVISQSKIGKAMSGDKITVVVSLGSDSKKDIDLSKIASYVSKDKEDAKKELNKKGIGLVVVSEDYSDTVKKDAIISQKINEDNNTLEVVISKGSKSETYIIVPNVLYRNETDAKKLLEANDLKVIVEEKGSNIVAKGAVISQSVPAGTKIIAGATVKIVVSTGKQEEKETAPTTQKAPQTTIKVPETITPIEKTTGEKKTKPTTNAVDRKEEKKYVADFRISTDKQTAKAGDKIKVSLHLKTNYRIFTVMAPIIYDGDVFEIQNTDPNNTSSFLTFEGQLAKTYTTNGNYKSPSQIYSRNSNEEYWTKSEVMDKWKIAYASWAANVNLSPTPVMLSQEETIVSFTLKVKENVTDTAGRIFISPDFQKTTDCVKGVLAVGRCKDDTISLNFADRDQTINVDKADIKVSIVS